MNDGQHCSPLLIPPESGFSHSGISLNDFDALLLAREECARTPSPRLSCYDGGSWSWLAPSGIPPPRERIDPDRPEGRHPISRATHSGCIRGPQRAPRGAQAVHPLRVRGRPRHLEGASAQNQEGKAVLHPVPSSTHVEGGEPVRLAPPGDRTKPNPDPGDGRSSAALAALRVAPLDPRRLIVGPRIPHGCPGEGYRRPEEGGGEAVRAPRRDRLGHERRFPRRGSCIGPFGGAPPRAVRRCASHPGDPLPTPTKAREEEGVRPEGRPTAPQPGGPEGTTSRAPAAPSRLQRPCATRDGGECRDRPRKPDALRCGRQVQEDEPPPLLLASFRNPSSNRVQSRPRGRACDQGEPSVDQ